MTDVAAGTGESASDEITDTRQVGTASESPSSPSTPSSSSSPSTDGSGPTATAGRFGPGSAGFTIVLSMSIAMTALAIDTILPAFADIRSAFGYAPDSTTVAGLVTAFMLGLGLGQVPAGLLADRYGRRPVLWGGFAIYILGALLALLAPTLPTMIAARVLWGLGGAGPRVAAIAMVRDAYKGEAMAKQMSTIMAVFLVVPMIAPTIGAGLLQIGPWQLTILFPMVFAAAVLALSTRLPATMPTDQRLPINVGEVLGSWKTVLATPGSIAYMCALIVGFGSFMAYISSSEAIVGETYGLYKWFGLVFGGISAFLALGIIVNGRIVERFGLRTMMVATGIGLIIAAGLMLVTAVAMDGVPPFGLFVVLLALTMMMMQVMQTNINAAALIPLGHVAGTASALFGMIPMIVGSFLATGIASLYRGPVTPFAAAFLLAGVIALASVKWATRAAPLTRDRDVGTGDAHLTGEHEALVVETIVPIVD